MQTEPRQLPQRDLRRREVRVIAAHHTLMRGESWPVAQYVGVNLVGSSVQLVDGVLSGFTASSYATMPWRMTAGATSLEAVVRFHWDGVSNTNAGIWGCIGSKDSFTPFYYEYLSINPGYFGCYLSNNGTSWTIGPTLGGKWAPASPAAGDYMLRLVWNGSVAKLLRWTGSSWVQDQTVSISSIYGEENLVPQLGTNRGQNYPLNGTIDLKYTYMMRDGALLWEGVKGAYRNVAKLEH